MFASCINLSLLDISMLDMDNCKNFTKIFDNDKELELYLDIYKHKNLIGEIPDYVKIIDVLTTPSIGEIECIYNILTVNRNILLLGKEFINNYSYIQIYINGSRIKYTK